MATNKNNFSGISESNLDEWLRSTGYLPSIKELELERFDVLYADYDFKLKDTHIDIQSIISGNACLCTTNIISLNGNDEELSNEINELRMVARKGQEIPSDVMQKMVQKHRKHNDRDK